ncbi:MAG: transporter substrate-binding domain-containing protein [Planctomycetes bacterium]|nr:transporter substrate-binding domain-containing protein [Planctomycetota bacterium]
MVSGTVPLSHKDHKVVGFPSLESLLRGFEQAQLDGALVDVDLTTWHLQKHSALALRLVDEFVSKHRWNLGMAVRAEDVALQNDLSRAIETCLNRAKFPQLFTKHGLVHRPPLVDVDEPKIDDEDTWQRVEEGGTLVVSMDPANLPYSSADPDQPGFDVEIAQALAKELGVKVHIAWIDVHRETATGQLLEHECDLAFGAAIDPDAMDDEEELAGKVIYSRPYYGTGYFLVARSGAPTIKSLADLKGEKSRRLGTQAGTIADYSLRQRGYLRRLFGTQLAVLTSLENSGIDYAYLWSNIGWILHHSPDVKAKLVPNFVPEDRWNIAIAMRRGDEQLKKHVDRALGRILEKQLVADALKRYHTPYFSPFELVDEAKPAGKKTTRHRPIDRGLEPQMSGRQRSRQSYSGLAKVRSRGTLVVGLDQNNLPFSTAHPKPAGLDYEIAQLLSEQLGVSLEVYWAYSSHDSYPSKLANKNLCDVMLGVMPDDRFANRVAYSEPYYFANYVYAVPSENYATDVESDLETQAIAVETGVALRGLKGRRVKSYANLNAILTAVATGETPVGYVLSSRAHWLSAQKWPGKIRFAMPSSKADRFGICAAVRRDETDLKNAIDAAWFELRQSGQLQKVFTRWQAPLDGTFQP